MRKSFGIVAVIAAISLFSSVSHAIENSCLDVCYGTGTKFKECMKLCRKGVVDFNGGIYVSSSKCPGDMEYIPSGSFVIGCSEEDKKCYEDETPARVVEISKGFCMDRNEVSQDQYKHVTGKSPSFFYWCGGKCPVESVSWSSADSYCRRVGKRLPTEAEWEYAARGGETARYFWAQRNLKAFAWFEENSFGRPHFSGKKLPNAYGLNDMAGNVLEWVQDCYDPNWYSLMPDTKHTLNNAANCQFRTLRGGSWNYPSTGVRVSDRTGRAAERAIGDAGFRCAR